MLVHAGVSWEGDEKYYVAFCVGVGLPVPVCAKAVVVKSASSRTAKAKVDRTEVVCAIMSC